MNLNDQSTVYPVSPMESAPQPRPTPDVSAIPLAAEQVTERLPLVEAIHQMFADAEAAEVWDVPLTWERAYPSDTAAYRLFMQEVQTELKHNSDAVVNLQQASRESREVTTAMVEAVFRAFVRATEAAARHLRSELSPTQLQALQRATRSDLDWSYRDLLVELVTAPAGAEHRYAPEDFFLILNPTARRIQYMERNEILQTLRHSLSRQGTDNLQRDVQAIRQYRADDQELLASDEYRQASDQPDTPTTK